MIGIDTNILLRWLIDDSIACDDAPHQTDLVARAINDSKQTCFANTVVVAETLWVVASLLKQSREVQAEIVERLLISFNVRIAEEAAVARALDQFRSGKADFSDCLIGALNSEAGCDTTLTFDKAAAATPGFTLLS